MIPFNSFSPERGEFLQLHDGSKIPKSTDGDASDRGVWKKVGDWTYDDYKQNDILYISKGSPNTLKIQYYTKSDIVTLPDTEDISPKVVVQGKQQQSHAI